MKAEIIAVGTEILLGDIVNTDAKFLSTELAALGITTHYQTVVGDNRERLLDAFKSGFERSDIIITSGGLGPTDDDITKETGAEFFGCELVLNDEVYARIKAYFKGREMAKTNIKQAYVPTGAIVLDNDMGTAPGIIIEKNNKILIMLPGPPSELVPMFNNSVRPYLEGREHRTIISRTLRLTGIGESSAAEAVRDIMANGVNPTVAPYAKADGVILRITAMGKEKNECLNLIEPVAREIYGRLGRFIYGENDTTLAGAVVRLLLNENLTVATAESLTGGMLSSAIVDIPGASRVFKEGFVVYTNESKIDTLGVSEKTIKYYGAVSAETAAEMAKGAAVKAGADIGISTTGIAGGGAVVNPTKNDTSYDKPVGRVYIGIYYKGKTMTKELNIKGSRQKVRNGTVSALLDFLRINLKEF